MKRRLALTKLGACEVERVEGRALSKFDFVCEVERVEGSSKIAAGFRLDVLESTTGARGARDHAIEYRRAVDPGDAPDDRAVRARIREHAVPRPARRRRRRHELSAAGGRRRALRRHAVPAAVAARRSAHAVRACIANSARCKPAIVHTHMAKAGMLGRLAALGYNLTRGSAPRARRSCTPTTATCSTVTSAVR